MLGRGFPGVGDLGVGGRGFPGAGDLGVGGRRFHGIGDLGVSSLSHIALWPPKGDSITDWITTLVTLLPALSASDAVWTCRRRDGLSPSTWSTLADVGRPSAVPCDTGAQ